MDTTFFAEQMNNMKLHYKRGGVGSFVLPLTVVQIQENFEAMPEDILVVEEDFKKSALEYFNENKTNGISATEQYKQDRNDNEFKNKMLKLRDDSKEEANKKLDELFEKMINKGEKHPKQQNDILKLSNGLCEFFQGNIVDGIVKIFSSLLNMVKEVIKKVTHFFTEIYNKIKPWIGLIMESDQLEIEHSQGAIQNISSTCYQDKDIKELIIKVQF